MGIGVHARHATVLTAAKTKLCPDQTGSKVVVRGRARYEAERVSAV